MTDPYRDASGTPCPRCRALMMTEDGCTACGNGCGAWLDAATVRGLVGTTDLVNLVPRGSPFKAWPLPPTRCLTCKKPLDDEYPKISDDVTLTLGICKDHGVWLEKRTRADFEAAYRLRIARHELEGARAADPPDDKTRIAWLEKRVAALESRLAALESHLSR